MAVDLEFIHIFIPIKLIDDEYVGGWPSWFQRWEHEIGRSAWFDETLYTQGAMDPRATDDYAVQWKRAFPLLFPLDVEVERDWHEGVGLYLGRDDWFTIEYPKAYLSGDEPGEVIFRDTLHKIQRFRHPTGFE